MVVTVHFAVGALFGVLTWWLDIDLPYSARQMARMCERLIASTVALSEASGTLTAIDTRNRGKIVWQVKTREPLVGGVLATAGGLVFVGEANGHLDAFDAATGGQLWSFQTGANSPCRNNRVGRRS